MTALYVREYGVRIGLSDGRVQVRRKDKVIEEIPALQLERIVMMTPASITAPALQYFMDRGVEIVYLSRDGRFYGAFSRGDGNYVKQRLAQHEKYHDDRFRLHLAGRFVDGKIANAIALWKRQKRRSSNASALQQLVRMRKALPAAKSLDALRGHEGAAAAAHFRLLREALRGDWRFKRRLHNPAPDPINAMLSFGYTLLYSRMASALQYHGLDPYLGFFHDIKRGHAALASDMIEEWRAPAVDALVLRLVNLRQITPADFHREKGGCRMSKAALEKYVEAFETHMRKLGASANDSSDPVGGLEGQVRQLIRLLLGKQKSYAPLTAF